MSGLWGATGLIVAAVMVQGFFSGSEMAIIASRWARLRQEAEEGDRRAALLVWLWRNPDRLLATIHVGSNMSIIAASVLATWVVVTASREWLGLLPFLEGKEEVLVTLVVSPLTLLFGEVVPKAVFQAGADRMAKRVVFPVFLAWVLFWPLTRVLTLFSSLVRRLAGPGVSPFVTREELTMVVRLRDLKTELKRHERRMIRRLFTFRETKAREVMVPMSRVAALEEEETLERALELFRSTRFTRFPVFRRRTFNIVGVLDIRACLHEPGLGRRVGRLMDRPLFVPDGRSIVDLLRDMERHGSPLAVVVDEYGGAVGIVTREDIIEEIVGELEDEHGRGPAGIRRLDASRVEIDAHLGVEYLSERLRVSIPPGDYDTAAGLMIQALGHIPARGEEVQAAGLSFRAVEVTPSTVVKILLTLPAEDASAPPGPAS